MSEQPAYSVEREFDIPVDILWAAWTDPIALEAWYHGVGHSTVPGTVSSDAQVGGIWSVGVRVPDWDVTAYFYGKYTAVVENARIEHTMHYTESTEEFELRDFDTDSHRVLVEFESRDFRSWVKYSQFGDMPERDAIEAQAGIESYFDSLESYLTVPQ